MAVLLAALLLSSGSQRADASEHGNAPAMTAEGELRVVHIDHFDRGRSETAYRLYRDGAPIADTSDLSYIDVNVTDGNIYSYTLMAVDNAGNESGLSSPAAYPPDGSGDGSGDGGSTSGMGHGTGGKPR